MQECLWWRGRGQTCAVRTGQHVRRAATRTQDFGGFDARTWPSMGANGGDSRFAPQSASSLAVTMGEALGCRGDVDLCH